MPINMSFNHRSGLVLGIFLLAFSLFGATSALAVGQVGDPAADFNLEDTWGQWHMLQDLRENTVVLLNVMGFG